MSDEKLINEFIETLEKTQNVKIWDASNNISNETIEKLKKIIKENQEEAINKHILRLFGTK